MGDTESWAVEDLILSEFGLGLDCVEVEEDSSDVLRGEGDLEDKSGLVGDDSDEQTGAGARMGRGMGRDGLGATTGDEAGF